MHQIIKVMCNRLGVVGVVALSWAMPMAAQAETHEVRMLNRGEAGAMVFEPAFLRIATGDSVIFRAIDRGHNAEVIKEMLPEGASGFKGGINEEITVTFDQTGAYGYKCAPHYSMGMVGLIVVGEAATLTPANLEAVKSSRIPPLARKHFDAWLAEIVP